MGDIWKGVTNTEIRDEFKHCNAYARKECKDCWAKLYCSGGCAANGYHATGSIKGVYEYGCELFRKRMECAIMIKVAENQELAAQGIEVPIELGSTCNASAMPAPPAKPANELHDHPHRGFCAAVCAVRHQPPAHARP